MRRADDPTPAPPLTFGLSGLSAQTTGRTSSDYHHELSRVLASAELAEAEGLDALWVGEHHFSMDGFLPSPLVLLAAIASRTDRIRIGTDVALAPLWDPVRFAEDSAVVDQLSAGRLTLALGLGYRDEEFQALGLRRQDRVQRLVELVRVAREAWSGATVGGLGTLDTEVPIRPLPHQPGGPPLWFGGFVRPAVLRARQLADGYVTGIIGPAGVAERIAWLLEEGPLSEDFSVGVSTTVFVASKDAEAIIEPVRAENTVDHWSWQHDQVAADSIVAARRATWSDGSGGEPPTSLIVGDPEACVERLAPFVRALGALPEATSTHLTAKLTYAGVADEHNDASVELFAREVVPALRELAAAAAHTSSS